MSNGGVPPQNQQRPAQPQQPVARTAPGIPIEYQRAYDLVNTLWNDDVAGAKIRSTAKSRYNIPLPDDAVDARLAPLQAKLDAMTKERDEERAANAKAKEDEAQNKQRTNIQEAIEGARNKYHLTQEGFDKMVNRMKETQNFTDAEAAAAWVVSNEPPPPNPGPSWAPKNIDLKGNLDKEKVKLLHDDPIQFQDNELEEFTKDPDKYVRETWGFPAQ
jgi:hypothetical protein